LRNDEQNIVELHTAIAIVVQFAHLKERNETGDGTDAVDEQFDYVRL